jgi:hypothetical protein
MGSPFNTPCGTKEDKYPTHGTKSNVPPYHTRWCAIFWVDGTSTDDIIKEVIDSLLTGQVGIYPWRIRTPTRKEGIGNPRFYEMSKVSKFC